MKRIRLSIEDPDNFLGRIIATKDDEYMDTNYHVEIEEGELPPRFPTMTYIADDCETFNSLVEQQKERERQEEI